MSGEQKFYYKRGKCDPSYGSEVGGGRNWGALLGLGNVDYWLTDSVMVGTEILFIAGTEYQQSQQSSRGSVFGCCMADAM